MKHWDNMTAAERAAHVWHTANYWSKLSVEERKARSEEAERELNAMRDAMQDKREAFEAALR